MSELGASGLDMNVVLTDEYYLLGSAEGMTFIASTGDTGGSGFAGGPEGTPGYPSTSPYVTAVGGTTTYLTYAGSQRDLILPDRLVQLRLRAGPGRTMEEGPEE